MGNNLQYPAWGRTDRPYARVAPASYADGIGAMEAGPSPRYVSNRVFNDSSQNVFSENGVTQWAATWGQFLDHNIGLAQGGDTSSPIAFDPQDPLEEFANDLGVIDFRRTHAAPGTGFTTPRQQINTVSSYLDGWAIYGGTPQRLEWLREGPVDGDLSNNGAHMLESAGGYLPSSPVRNAPAPEMQLMGRLRAVPHRAIIAGDVRANENIALTSVHTLFAREHNRIVSALPIDLSGGDEIPDRARDRHGGDHTSRTPSSCPPSGSTPPTGIHSEGARRSPTSSRGRLPSPQHAPREFDTLPKRRLHRPVTEAIQSAGYRGGGGRRAGGQLASR